MSAVAWETPKLAQPKGEQSKGKKIDTEQAKHLLLSVYIQPKASRDILVGFHADELKIAITAPPVDNKANGHLIKFLAKTFKVPKRDVEIIKGQQSRHKQIRIISPQILPTLILERVSS